MLSSAQFRSMAERIAAIAVEPSKSACEQACLQHLSQSWGALAWATELGEKYGLNLVSFHPDSGTEHYLDMLKTHGPLLSDAVFEAAKPG